MPICPHCGEEFPVHIKNSTDSELSSWNLEKNYHNSRRNVWVAILMVILAIFMLALDVLNVYPMSPYTRGSTHMIVFFLSTYLYLNFKVSGKRESYLREIGFYEYLENKEEMKDNGT
jgi:hypothetical protein